MARTLPYRIFIYDTNGNLVSIPVDILSGSFEDVVNGGSGAGQFSLPRRFVDVGEVNYEYRVQFYLADSVDPWYDGRIVDFDQEQMENKDSETIIVYTDGWRTRMSYAITSDHVDPGVQPNGQILPLTNADTFLAAEIASKLDSATFGTSYLSSIPVALDKLTFDGTELDKAIEDIVKQVNDNTGNTYEWWVRGKAGGKPQLVIQPNANPNKVTTTYRTPPTYTGTTPSAQVKCGYNYEWKNGTIQGYKQTNSGRQIYNMVAAYGGPDPMTKINVYGAFKDSLSISLYGLRQKKITNSVVTSQKSLSMYATVYLLLNGYPQPQTTFKKVAPSDEDRAGVWYQIMEPSIGVLTQNIKQERCIKVHIDFGADSLVATMTCTAPRPFIDNAYYAAIGQASRAQTFRVTSTNLTTYFIAAGFNWIRSGSINGQPTVDISPPSACFNSLTPVSMPGGPNADFSYTVALVDSVITGSSGTGDGRYEVLYALDPLTDFSVMSHAPGFVVVKGSPSPYNPNVMHGWSFMVINGAISGSQDLRIYGGINAANINFGNHPFPVLAAPVTLISGFTDNSIHAQVDVPQMTITNCTVDNTVSGVYFQYRLHGAVNDSAMKPLDGMPLVDTKSAIQNIGPFGFEVGAGQLIDVFMGFAGVGSKDYGPTIQLGSAAQIANGFIPASLVVTNAYLGAGNVTAPNVTSPLYLFVDSANGISSSVTLWFTITNQLTNGSLSRIAIYRRKTGSGALFDKVFDVPAIGLPHPSALQAYIVTANDLTNGVAYDWGVAFEDNQGGEAPPVPTNGIETRFADPAHGLIEQTPAIQVNIATALNVRSFGAKGDGKYTPYGHMLLGSTSLTLILESPFVSSDVGKTIMVGGAAAGGSDLYTTITAFINSTTVTLALAASTQVSNTGTFWGGTDDTAAIQSAINAAIDTASNVYIPAGTYLISSSLNYSPKLRRLFGDGPYKTNLIVTSPSINADIISFYDTNYFTLEGIYFRGPGINAGAGGVRFDLNIFGSQEGLIVKNVVVEGTGGNGVHMNAPILSTLENVKCYATAGFGFWAYNGTSTSFSKCYALTGVVDGFHLQSMTYCTMDSCAAEYAGSAYNLYNSNNITLNGCGGEQQMNRSVGYPGHAYVIDHCQSIVMNSCYSREVPAGVARHFIARGGSSNVHVNQMRVVQVGYTDFDAEIAAGCSNIVFSSPSFTIGRLLNYGTSCGILDGFGNDTTGNTPFGHGSMSPGTQQAISVSTGGILSTTYDIVSWAAGSGAATLASRNIAIPAGGTWISITTTFIGERNLSALVSFNAPGGYSGSAGWNPSDASINSAGDTSLPYTIVSILYGLPGGQTITVTATTTATSHTGTQTYGSGNMVTQLIRYA